MMFRKEAHTGGKELLLSFSSRVDVMPKVWRAKTLVIP